MQLRFQKNTETIVLDVEPEGEVWRVRLSDGTERHITARRLPNDVLQITEHQEDGGTRTFRVPFARLELGITFSWSGLTYTFTLPTPRAARGKDTAASGELFAPMVGVVADVLIQEGQTVEAYHPLVLVEAMKVMASVDAPFAGTVKKLYVEKGQRVEQGAPVVEIEKAE